MSSISEASTLSKPIVTRFILVTKHPYTPIDGHISQIVSKENEVKNITSPEGILTLGNPSSPIRGKEEKLPLIIEFEEVCVKVLPCKSLRKSKLVRETSVSRKDANHVLLARPGLRTSSEFRIFNKDYTYFFGLHDDYSRAELVELAYQVLQASSILAFNVVILEESFLPDHYCREYERLKMGG